MTEDEVLEAGCVHRDALIKRCDPLLFDAGAVDFLVFGPIDRMRLDMRSKVTRAQVSIYQALRAETGSGHD